MTLTSLAVRRAEPRPGRRPRETGTVTAELAVALPGVVLLAVLLALTGQAVIAQVRCADAARAGARLAARGEPTSAVLAEAGRRAPPGARTQVSAGAAEVTVVVSYRLAVPAGRWVTWAAVPLGASASAAVESTGP
jgi:hypothetical protein